LAAAKVGDGGEPLVWLHDPEVKVKVGARVAKDVPYGAHGTVKAMVFAT
jgi:hypothetical protein